MNTITLTGPDGAGPCVKQTVTATLVALDGSRYISTNFCDAPQTICPRAAMPTGIGYQLCKSICRQFAHAEVNALRLAGERAVGGVLYVEAHTYACESCLETAKRYGVTAVVIGRPPEVAE